VAARDPLAIKTASAVASWQKLNLNLPQP